MKKMGMLLVLATALSLSLKAETNKNEAKKTIDAPSRIGLMQKLVRGKHRALGITCGVGMIASVAALSAFCFSFAVDPDKFGVSSEEQGQAQVYGFGYGAYAAFGACVGISRLADAIRYTEEGDGSLVQIKMQHADLNLFELQMNSRNQKMNLNIFAVRY